MESAQQKISLSICIATLNRGDIIGETLESIVSQATDAVEIVIVDGGSSDNTGEVVEAFRRRFHRIRYFPQNAGKGLDRGFSQAVERARGDYCWLMSDDDLLKQGAIQAVLAAIRHAYGLIVVNSEVKTVDFSRLLVARRLPFDADRLYRPTEFQRFFVEVGEYLGFIGCVVIRRDIWNDRAKEPYFGSYFIHVGVIFQRPITGDILFLATPYITIRSGNAMWTSRSFEIWRFNWPNLIWSFQDFPDRSKERICPREPWRSVSSLLMSRGMGTYGVEEYRTWIRPRTRSPRERFAAWVVARSPGILVNFLGLIFFSVAGRRYAIARADLRASRFHFRNIRMARSRRHAGG